MEDYLVQDPWAHYYATVQGTDPIKLWIRRVFYTVARLSKTPLRTARPLGQGAGFILLMLSVYWFIAW